MNSISENPIPIREKGGIMEAYFRKEYGRPNLELRKRLFAELGPGFQAHAEQVINNGITRIRGLFSSKEVAVMQSDIEGWKATKNWDRDKHIGFDGNSGEQYLETSEAISGAVTHPGLHSLVTAAFGQHPKLSFLRTVLLDPVEPYERRAFQWHHDGYSEFGLKAMLLLTDVPDNGQAMLLVPSSQRRSWETASSRETKFTPEFASQFDPYTCSGEAGDLFVFNPHAIHRGQRNDTVRRDIVLFNFQSGLARNYPIPRIAPGVASSMSDYERQIFGVDGQIESGSLTEASFPKANDAWRGEIDTLYQGYSLPIRQLQDIFRQELLDQRINEAGKHNMTVRPQIEMFVDGDKVKHLEKFKSTTQIKLHTINEELARFQSIDQALAEYGIDLPDQITTDLAGDLDLPIRMYHPNKDQRRDNAITQTRDGRGDHIADIMTHLNEMNFGEVVSADAADYETTADHILRHKGAILSLPEDQDTKLHTDAFLSLLSDSSEMIKRAYSLDLARRTMLYTYLAGRTLVDKYCNDERLRIETRQQLTHDTDEALVDYVKLMFVNKEKPSGTREAVLFRS